MLLEILALILGVIAGTITGILPGVHINLVAAFLLSSLTYFLTLTNPLSLAIFIVAMSITHTFLDFIPSIFLGAPDESSSLSVLPGHDYLLKGKGYEAVIYTLYGSLIAIPIILIFTPIFIFLLPGIFYYLRFVMFLVLTITSIYLILNDKNRTLAFLVFMLSGFLGISSLNLNLNNSLLPLLSGLFGGSSLVTSIIKKQKLKKQEILRLKSIKLGKAEIKNVSLTTLFASPICSFLPALGSSQAAIISSSLLEKIKQKEFLMLLGSINTIVMGLSFVTLYAIGKSRTGSAVAIGQILSSFTLNSLLIILFAIILSAILASIITVFMAKIFAKNITRINYSKLSIFILIFLSLVVILFSGWLGLLIFIVATATGLIAILLGVRRTHLMGALMLPTILLYLPFIG